MSACIMTGGTGFNGFQCTQTFVDQGAKTTDDCGVSASNDEFDGAVKSLVGMYVGIVVGVVLLCCVLPIALCFCGCIACGKAAVVSSV